VDVFGFDISAFSRWYENVMKKKVKAAKSHKVVARLKNRATATCLDAWHHTTIDEARKQALMGCIIMRMKNQLFSAALERWSDTIVALKVEQAAEEHNQLIMQRIVRRMLNATISSALETWDDNATALRVERAREECKQLSMQQIMRRMLNAALIGAFLRWCQKVQERTTMAAKARKVLARWIYHTVVMRLDAWREYAVEEMRKRLLMKRILMRMSGGLISGSFERWVHKVHQLQKKSTEQERKQDLMKRIVSRMINKVMAQGLERWSHQAVAARQLKAKAFKVVRRFITCALVRSFERWCLCTRERMLLKVKATGVVVRLIQSSVFKYFETWRRHCALTRRVVRVLRRLLRTVIVASFERWVENVDELKVLAGKACRVMLQCVKHTSAMFCDLWRSHCREQHALRHAVLHLCNRNLMQALERWRQDTRDQQQRARITRRVLQRFLCKTLALALEGWQNTAAHLVSVHATTAATRHRRRKRLVSNVINMWNATARHQRALTVRCLRFVGLRTRAALVKAFSTCKALTHFRVHARAIIQNNSTRRQNMWVARVLYKWTIITQLFACKQQQIHYAFTAQVKIIQVS